MSYNVVHVQHEQHHPPPGYPQEYPPPPNDFPPPPPRPGFPDPYPSAPGPFPPPHHHENGYQGYFYEGYQSPLSAAPPPLRRATTNTMAALPSLMAFVRHFVAAACWRTAAGIGMSIYIYIIVLLKPNMKHLQLLCMIRFSFTPIP